VAIRPATRQLESGPKQTVYALAAEKVCCITTSRGVPVNWRPPMSEYSPSVFSRTTTKSMSAAVRPASGLRTPGRRRTGRRFTYWSKCRRMGRSKTPEGHVVRYTRGAHRAEQNGVEGSQALQSVRRHHDAVLVVVGAGVWEGLEGEVEGEACGQSLEGTDALRYDLTADAVSRYQGDSEGIRAPWGRG